MFWLRLEWLIDALKEILFLRLLISFLNLTLLSPFANVRYLPLGVELSFGLLDNVTPISNGI